jgi:hypothetical protein
LRRISTDAVLSAAPDGVRLKIRLTPRGRADRIDGVAAGALKVSVTAPPAENRANDALLRLLAREWHLPQRDLAIVAGMKSRDKSVMIRGDPDLLLARLALRISDAA